MLCSTVVYDSCAAGKRAAQEQTHRSGMGLWSVLPSKTKSTPEDGRNRAHGRFEYRRWNDQAAKALAPLSVIAEDSGGSVMSDAAPLRYSSSKVQTARDSYLRR